MAAARWTGGISPWDPGLIDGAATVVDAVFGAGLSRPLPASVVTLFNAARDLPCIAVDLPSGVDGDTGLASPGVVSARATVTFHRLKPAHVLFPGRALAGEIVLADIGVTGGATSGAALLNGPGLWRGQVRQPDWRSHKYQRGHVVVVGGPIGGRHLVDRQDFRR
jgi:NAD(P)H-hydrate epimerase